jgi:peptide-methionine (R)-S-oxide reductase
MTHQKAVDTRAEKVDAARRFYLLAAPALLAAAGLGARRAKAAPEPVTEVLIEDFSITGQSLGSTRLRKIIKSDAEWRALLSPLSFEVTRREGTERPFSGVNLKQRAAGIYRCICCDTALFDAGTKFESGTGWPSFWQPIAKSNVAENVDRSFGTTRTAVSCRRCDAHLGHVFDDGPKPTGLRYCMNSVALRFVASAPEVSKSP